MRQLHRATKQGIPRMKKIFLLLSAALLLSFALARLALGIGENNPTGVTGEYNGSISTAGSYDPFSGNGKRFICDITVTGSVGAYPLNWTRILNTRAGGSAFGTAFWSHSYRWGLWLKELDGTYTQNQYEGPMGELSYPDGREITLMSPDTNVWVPALPVGEPMDRLVYVEGGDYDLVMRDGGWVRFQHGTTNSSGVTHYTPVTIVDPYGQTTTLHYDSQSRLDRVTEPAGRYLQISYQSLPTSSSPNAYLDAVSSVQAFDGRGNLVETVSYHYSPQYASGMVDVIFQDLTQVDYDDGNHAFYSYYPAGDSTNSAWSMTAGPVQSCDDVRFAGPMKRIQYEYMVRSQAHPEIAWGQVKAEKNLTTGQTVSEMEYPSYQWGQWDPGWRNEHRPDGALRSFQYSGGELSSYTDFLNHTSTIAYTSGPGADYYKVFTDARGNTTTVGKEGIAGQVMFVKHGSAQPFTYTYTDAANPYYVASTTDELGHTTYYDRDGANRITQTRYPDGSSEQFTSYNGFGQVLTHLMTSGGTETFTYNGRGLKTNYTDPYGNLTSYNYYQSGPNTDRLLNVVDPRGNVTWYEYNWRGEVTKVTHQDGSYTQSGYNPDGTLAWSADENHPNASWNENERTRYTYDEYKRVLTVTNPLNQTTSYYYGLDWANPLIHTTSNPKVITSPMGKYTVFAYDENFRKLYQVQATWTADEAWTWFGYDAVGNNTWVYDPRGYTTVFAYDNRNRQITVTNPLNETTTVQYDFASNKTREIRPDGTFRSWDYDAMNRLHHAYDWRTNEIPTAEQTTTHSRNTTGTIQWITDSKGAVYTFGYDALNRKTSENYPPDSFGVNRTETWHYDPAGNMDQHANPVGQVQTLTYDNRNRLASYSWNWSGGEPGVPVSYGWPNLTTTYDAASRVTSLITNSGETIVSFGYDAANHRTDDTQQVSGYTAHTIHTDYDADGNRSFAYSETRAWCAWYAYTQRNQIAAMGDGNSGWQWFAFTYDLNGNLTRRHNWAGHDQVLAYDELNRTSMVESWFGSGPFARSWYQYDSLGRETATWRDEQSSRGERFAYTPNNQLASVLYNAYNVWLGGTPANWTRAVDYNYTPDRLNRSSVNDNGAVANYTPNALNQYVNISGQAISYNENFSLYHANGWQYNYDANNRLTSMWGNGHSATFVYDGLGRCLKRTIDGVTKIHLYDEWRPAVDHDGANNFSCWNLYGPAGVDDIILRASTSSVQFYHKDRLGSVKFVTDGGQTVLEKYSYDAFGQPTIMDGNGNPHTDGNGNPQSAYGNRFMFTGREYLSELGLYDYRHRFYHPGLGRFLQTDPTGFDAGDMNLFRYCDDDPVDRSDPMGLLSGYNKYTLVSDDHLIDDTHDGWKIQGVDGTQSKPGDLLLEVEREVSRHPDVRNDQGQRVAATTGLAAAADDKGIHVQIHVRYATKDGAGEHSRAKAATSEVDHSREHVSWANNYRDMMANKVRGMSPGDAARRITEGRGGRYDSDSLENRRHAENANSNWRHDSTMANPHYPDHWAINPQTGKPYRVDE
jgi:RHS repeat-associated protein